MLLHCIATINLFFVKRKRLLQSQYLILLFNGQNQQKLPLLFSWHEQKTPHMVIV